MSSKFIKVLGAKQVSGKLFQIPIANYSDGCNLVDALQDHDTDIGDAISRYKSPSGEVHWALNVEMEPESAPKPPSEPKPSKPLSRKAMSRAVSKAVSGAAGVTYAEDDDDDDDDDEDYDDAVAETNNDSLCSCRRCTQAVVA